LSRLRQQRRFAVVLRFLIYMQGTHYFFHKKDDINKRSVNGSISIKQGCENMKIGEARQIYRDQVHAYRKQKSVLNKQLEEVRSRMKHMPGDEEQKKAYESEAATLQLTLDALDEKESEYQEYLDQLTEKYCAYWNTEVAKQQKEAGKEAAAEMGKIMEVARRLMKGAIVPASDEKKLMEFSMDMYQVAKNIGAMARQEKKDKYESLWGEEKKTEQTDPRETAENADAGTGAPEILDLSDTMLSAGTAE